MVRNVTESVSKLKFCQYFLNYAFNNTWVFIWHFIKMNLARNKTLSSCGKTLFYVWPASMLTFYMYKFKETNNFYITYNISCLSTESYDIIKTLYFVFQKMNVFWWTNWRTPNIFLKMNSIADKKWEARVFRRFDIYIKSMIYMCIYTAQHNM